MPQSNQTNRWTPALRDRFLAYLEEFGDVSAACAACGLSRQSIYRLRRRDPAFGREWDAALARLDFRQNAELAAVVASLQARARLLRIPPGHCQLYQPRVNQLRPR